MREEEFLLACESSCDETAFSLLEINSKKILFENIYSQILTHNKFNGVVPELASKEHLERIDFLCKDLLLGANKKLSDIDYFSSTVGPGLPGSLFIGINYVKALAWHNKKPFIPINHLEGHIYSVNLENNIEYPAICLSASGGHTALYYVKDDNDYNFLGNTVDDAAGECFDKISKLLGFGYPGGKIIEQLAEQNNFKDDRKYPRLKDKNYNFSFSGLKTFVLYDLIKNKYYDLKTKEKKEIPMNFIRSVCSSLLCAVSDILCSRILLSLEEFKEIKSCTFVGGVSCNLFIRKQIEKILQNKNIKLYTCSPRYCIDNASMIAIRAANKIEFYKKNNIKIENNYDSTAFSS